MRLAKYAWNLDTPRELPLEQATANIEQGPPALRHHGDFPMALSKSSEGVKSVDGWHQAMEWTLLALIAIHVGSAMLHVFYYRDHIMERML